MNYEGYAAFERSGFKGDPSCSCPVCGEGTHFVEELGSAFIALERARVIAVLDEWSSASGGKQVMLTRAFSGRTFTIELVADSRHRTLYEGATPDDARKAAADAIARGEV